MSDTALIKKPKGSAAGQYLGYALQPVRLLYHLLTCPSAAHVGLEYVDDVSVHLGDKVLHAEQCKSALSGNPTSIATRPKRLPRSWKIAVW